MPKQIWKIDQFHGGINNVADSRDILDNQLVSAKNVYVDKLGQIVPKGASIVHPIINQISNIVTEGYGLYIYYTDYALLDNNNAFADELSYVDGGQANIIHHSDGGIFLIQLGANGNNNYTIQLIDSTNGLMPSILSSDGAIVITDSNVENDYISKHLAIFESTNFPSLGLSWTEANIGVIQDRPSPPDGILKSSSWIEESGETNHITTIHHDDTDGDTWSIFGWGYTGDDGVLDSGAAILAGISSESNDDKFGVYDGTNGAAKFITSIDGPKLYTNNCASAWSNNAQLFPPTGGLILDTYKASSQTVKWPTGHWDFFYAYLYWDGYLSQLSPLHNTHYGHNPDSQTAYNTDFLNSGDYDGPQDMYTFNPRLRGPFPPGVVGIKVYAQERSHDPLSYEVMTINFEEEQIENADGQRELWVDGGITGDVSIASIIRAKSSLQTPYTALVTTYETETGRDSDSALTEVRYKTAVVSNRRSYVGNVSYIDHQGRTVTRRDRMLKSKKSTLDIFDKHSILDVVVADGDEITALATYADRILQFKNNALYIINVSQGIEFLEATYHHKGALNSAAVTTTDIGIAWVNTVGAFLYDGETVHNLIENNGIKIIDWSVFATTNTSFSIGYLSKENQIIIIGNNDRKIYIYDLVVKAWVNGDFTTNLNIISNMVYDRNGDLLYIQNGSSTATINSWGPTSEDQDVEIITKDIDFESSGQRKKIYKVYVTYTGGINNNIDVSYRTNGNGLWLQFDGNLDSSTAQQVEAELKPIVSINNIKSIQLKFYGTASSTFKLNDISIVYRLKGIK